MKHLLNFVLSTLVFISAQAQIVTIPDANFKNVLINHDPVIDTNFDGEIQVSEAEAYSEYIIAYDEGINNLEGIQAFTNITWFNAALNNLSTIPDISSMTALERIRLWGNSITSIDVTGNPGLIELGLSNNFLNTLDLSNSVNLETLNVEGNNFLTLDISPCQSLYRLDIMDNPLNSIDVTQNPNLKFLGLNDTNVSNLDLSNSTSLEVLWISDTPISTLDLQSCESLIILESINSLISSLDFTGTPIKAVRVIGPSLQSVDFSGTDTLEFCILLDTSLSQVDLSNQVNLCGVSLNFNEELLTINLQNGANENLVYDSFCSVMSTADYGISASSGVYISDNNSLTSICVDDVDYSIGNWDEVFPNTLFTETCALSIASEDMNTFRCIPNPTDGKIALLGDFIEAELMIHASTGSQMGSYKVSKARPSIDLSNFPSGLYFVQIMTENGGEVLKVIKE